MARQPQPAVLRLLQGITSSRNVSAGDRIAIEPNLIVLGPIDGLAVLKAFRLGGGDRIANPERVILFTDDKLPAMDEAAARRRVQLREAARKAGITRVLPLGGCEVPVLLEQSHVVPGECAVSCLPEIAAVGGIGALGLRVTVPDMAMLLRGKPLRLTAPQSMRVDLIGRAQAAIGGFDLFFALRRELSRGRLSGAALEINGEGLATLELHERVALCAQAAQGGSLAAFCLVERTAVQELNRRILRPYTTIEPAPNAAYAHRATFELEFALPAALPPGGARSWMSVGAVKGEPIDLVVIRGGIEALRRVTSVIKGRQVAVRCVVIPESPTAFESAAREGLLTYLLDARVELHPPGTPLQELCTGTRTCVVTAVAAPENCWRVGHVVAATAACEGTFRHPSSLQPGQR